MSKITNLGPKFDHRITLRLTDDQMNFLNKTSTIMGVSPSDYLRMVVNSAMVSMSGAVDKLLSGQAADNAINGGLNENIESDKHDIV